MTTTLEAWRGRQAGNYCDKPTIDVEILADQPRYCATCEVPVVEAGPVWPGSFLVRWRHAVGPTDRHYVTPSGVCVYCGASKPGVVVYRQHPYHDARECSRCGGIDGYGIGD